MSDRTDFNMFIFQGDEYPLNTIVKIKDDVYILEHGIGSLCEYPMVQIVESFLDWRGIHRWTYAIWFKSGHVGHYTTAKNPDEMVDSIVGVVEEVNENGKPEYYKDSEVDGVYAGWMIYITVMVCGIIFRDVAYLWVFATFYFFKWRREKLRKPVEYKYGFDVYKKVGEWNERQT